MTTTRCPDAVHIYPQDTRRSCLLCGVRKPFDPADYTAPWPSWAGLKTGDTIHVQHSIAWGGKPDDPINNPWPAVVLSTHRGGAIVEVAPPDGAGVEARTQYVMQCENGVYAR